MEQTGFRKWPLSGRDARVGVLASGDSASIIVTNEATIESGRFAATTSVRSRDPEKLREIGLAFFAAAEFLEAP